MSDFRKNKTTDQDGVVRDALSENRKAYQPPVLVPWGTLRDVTRAAGFSGSSDGGKLVLRKTRW